MDLVCGSSPKTCPVPCPGSRGKIAASAARFALAGLAGVAPDVMVLALMAAYIRLA
jgi:hypothetical protein